MKKTSAMEVGAIGYHDASKVKNLWVVKDKEIVKRLDKTKEVCIEVYFASVRVYSLTTL